MSSELSREALEATFSELTHLLIIPARLTSEKAELGIGGFGEVGLATLDESSESQRKVAVKQLLIARVGVVRGRIAFRLARELKVWAKVKHPNILELIGYYLSEDYVCAQLVSAFMVNGNVKQYIERSHPSPAIRLKFVRDIATGLTYLHDFNPPICHGDLKPPNILVNESLDAVLCDFGVSSFIHESDAVSGLTTSKSTKGSPRYMSPELSLQDESKHTLQSDVWAWGCTALELMTDSVPYPTRDRESTIILDMHNKLAPGSIDALNTVVLGTDVDPACQSGVSSLRSILPQCWDFDPIQRPSSSRILQHITTSSNEKTPLGSRKDQKGEISPLASQGESDAAQRKKPPASAKAAAAPVKKPLQANSLPPNRKGKEKESEKEKKADRGKAVDKQKQQPAGAPSPRPNQGGRPAPQTPAAKSAAKQAGPSKATPGKKEKPNQTDAIFKKLAAVYTNTDPKKLYRDVSKVGQNISGSVYSAYRVSTNEIVKSTKAYFGPTSPGQDAKAPKPIKPADKPKPAPA